MRLWGYRRLPALSFLGGSEAFDLLEVVDVVASHGFDDGPEGHGAAFGVGGAAVAIVLRDGVEEEQVPVARGLEERHGGFELVGVVTFGPGFLVEGLDDGVGLIEFGARVWRRRKEKTISQSARWATISRMLHLRGAGRVLI